MLWHCFVESIGCSIAPKAPPTPEPLTADHENGSSLPINPRFKALLIGIGPYDKDEGWEALPTDHDVEILSAALSKGGYAVRTLSPSKEKPVTRDFVIEEARKFSDGLAQFDTAVVYVSSHGFLDRDGRAFFVPPHCRASNIAKCGLSIEDLYAPLNGSHALRKLLLVDSCHSGRVADEPPRSFDFSQRVGPLAVLTASKADEDAQLDGRSSLFTAKLVEVLSRDDLLAADGHISLKTLAVDTQDRVNERALVLRATGQHPTLYPSSADFPIIEAPQYDRQSQRIATLSKQYRFDPLTPDQLTARYAGEQLLKIGTGRELRVLPFVPITTPGTAYSRPAVALSMASTPDYAIDSQFDDRTERLWKVFGLMRGANLRNDKKMKIFDIRVSESPQRALTLYYGISYYRDYLGTNLTSDFLDLDASNHRLRDDLEPGPTLLPLMSTKCANHLGISAIVTTSDGWVVYARSADSVATFPNMLGPGVSASCSPSQCGPPGDPFAAIVQQADDELGLQTDEILDTRLIGVARELRRAGKPEAYFHMFTRLTLEELQAGFEKERAGHAKDRHTRDAPSKAWSIAEIVSYPAVTAHSHSGAFRTGDETQQLALFDRPDVSPPTLGALAFYLHWARQLPNFPFAP